MDFLKVGKATDLAGRDRKIYRLFEIFPGFLSLGTLIVLVLLSWLAPFWAAYFIIAFSVYWLLLVIYLSLHLVSAYQKLKINLAIDWREKCREVAEHPICEQVNCLAKQGVTHKDITQIIIFPTSYEGLDIIRPSIESVANDGFPTDQMILVLATEERAGEEAQVRARQMQKEFGQLFQKFIITKHPEGIAGELKGKGANQAWAAKELKEKLIDKEKYDYDRLLVSIFDMDTQVTPGYFSCVAYKFLTVSNPYRASYQPVPLYNNNIWDAPFISRVAANSNTFWQMMQQIRYEKLATYSSHSMTWKALSDIGFWSTNMVSEDSRITWHCFFHYNGDYRVEPLHFPVSMDATAGANFWLTVKNLYKQQRRWGWGVENVPYLMFNMKKRWKIVDKKKAIGRLFIQLYGFHSWATNALIIGVIGWMPMLLGGDKFNATVLSSNLPVITRTLMMIAMSGLVLSAIISTLLLPKRPKHYGFGKNLSMVFQWLVLPLSIVVFGSIPGLEAQIRLMLGKYMGFQVTPKGEQAKQAVNIWDQK